MAELNWRPDDEPASILPGFIKSIRSEQERQRAFFSRLDENARQRFESALPSPNWSALDAAVDVGTYGFASLYCRLRDFVRRVALASTLGDDELRSSVESLVPQSGTLHSRHSDWFYEYALAAVHGHQHPTDEPPSETLTDRLRRLFPSQSAIWDEMALHRTCGAIDYFRGTQLLNKYDSLADDTRISGTRYTIVTRLAANPLSVVYRVQDESLSRALALKIPRHEHAPLKQTSLRPALHVFREARLQQQLGEIPGVIRVMDILCPLIDTELDDDHISALLRYSLYDSPLGVLFQFVPNGTLSSRLTGKPWPLADACQLVHRLAETLAAVHRRAVMHRDIKSGNILFDEDDNPLIGDFGLAIRPQEMGVGEGYARGTLVNMAPEVLTQGDQTTYLADIWSLGVVLYQLITGTLPFDHSGSDWRMQIREKILRHSPADPRIINDTIDGKLCAIVLRCLEKVPERRYRSAAVLANELLDWLETNRSGGPGNVKLYAWHPNVFAIVSMSPVFVVLQCRSFDRENVFSKLKLLLSECGVLAYRIYQMLGHYDIVIRCYIPASAIDEFHSQLDGLVGSLIVAHSVHRVDPSRIEHWAWAADPQSPSMAQVVRIEELLKEGRWDDSKEIDDAIAGNLIRRITPTHDNILAFILLRSHASKRQDTNVTRKIEGYVRTIVHDHTPLLKNPAIYWMLFDPSSTFGLIKAEVDIDCLFDVTKVVNSLNKELARYECVTMTCIVASPEIDGQELLGAREYEKSIRKSHVRKHFPKLYEVRESGEHFNKIESWGERFVEEGRHESEYVSVVEGQVQGMLVAAASRNEEALIAPVSGFLRTARRCAESILSQLRLYLGTSLSKTASDKDTSDKGLALKEILELASQRLAIVGRCHIEEKWDEVERLKEWTSDTYPGFEATGEWVEFIDNYFAAHKRLWTLIRGARSGGLDPSA